MESNNLEKALSMWSEYGRNPHQLFNTYSDEFEDDYSLDDFIEDVKDIAGEVDDVLYRYVSMMRVGELEIGEYIDFDHPLSFTRSFKTAQLFTEDGERVNPEVEYILRINYKLSDKFKRGITKYPTGIINWMNMYNEGEFIIVPTTDFAQFRVLMIRDGIVDVEYVPTYAKIVDDESEIEIYKIMSKNNISPVFIMSDDNLLITELYPINNIKRHVKIFQKDPRPIIQSIVEKINKLHELGYLWVDNHEENIVMDCFGDVRLIDFEHTINQIEYTEELASQWYDCMFDGEYVENYTVDVFKEAEILEVVSWVYGY